MKSRFFPLAAVALAAATLLPRPAGATLAEYVAKADPSTHWEEVRREKQANCDVIQITLTSQTWQGIKWDHDLVLIVPEGVPTDRVFILNNGGKASLKTALYGQMLATRMKAPVALLLGIPNQPLFDGKKEDDLIAETFCRYLDTKDDQWPLLFPMVKSVIRAMDAVQEFSAKNWPKKAEKFVLGGASKRGWTTWLTAAVDPRLMAITPMVIDTLNFQKQIPHQLDCFGAYSEQIRPYTSRGLVPLPDTDEGRKLWSMVDPWRYREKYSMPKLIVCGNNDPYWSSDALNLYWDDLSGPKYISYTPNAGHDLTEKNADGSKGDAFRAINNVCAFVRRVFTDQPMPTVTWKHEDCPDGKCRLSIDAKPAPKSAKLWRAEASSRDFRKAQWASKALDVKDQSVETTVDKPASGYSIFYADLEYMVDDIPQFLCTQVRIVGAATP